MAIAAKLARVLAVPLTILVLADRASANLHRCDHGKWFSAARAGVLKDVRACLLGGADVEMRNAAGCTAAHAAASNGHFEILRLLRERSPGEHPSAC